MAVIQAGEFSTGCRAVLFDKDGTLIDFKTMWLVWLEYIFNTLRKIYGLNKDIFAEFEKAIGVNLDRQWIDPNGIMASGCMISLRNSMAQCLASCGVEMAEAMDTFDGVVKASESEVDWAAITLPVPGLEAVLRRFEDAGIKMAVVTADTTPRAEDTLISLNLSSYFQAVIGADRVENSKPAPDMALLACELLEIDPLEAVVVGDNITDMQMGRGAGLAGVIGVLTGVCRREQLKPLADVVVNSIAGIKVY